ncbi:lysostaphin resistance A-like protein [Niallia sp. 01092]|uniref:lysostaphin resistance A-like protein n=1 Tax=unclassified Niallia TaxID=2837522 RepID=UPI003FD489BA
MTIKSYLNVTEGKNSWKRYLSSVLIAIAFMFVGSIIYGVIEAIMVYFDGDESTYIDFDTAMPVGINPNLNLLLTHIVNILWVIGIWIGVRFIHKRRFITLITPNKTIHWGRVLWGFAVFGGLLILTTLIDFLFNSSEYSWNNVHVKEYIILFLIVLILVPIQTTSEELFFRGMLLQWIGKRLKQPILLSLIIGLIFGSMHFANPEMGKSFVFVGLDYIVTGFALTYISVKTGSLELSIGAHAANNMFLFWFLTTDDSVAGDIPSLFKTVNDSPGISLIWSIVIFIVFYLLSRKKVNKERS